MNNQSEIMIEIVGLELLHKADLMYLVQQLDEMSFSGHSGDDNDTYAKDSIQLERVTAGARRHAQRRRNSVDSYANDSVKITKKYSNGDNAETKEEKDQLPSELVFHPLKTEAPVDDQKDLPSTQLGAKDLTKLKPHSMTNRAA